MARPVAATGDFAPAVRLERERFRHPHRRAIADDRIVEDRNEAAFGIIVDLAADFAGRIDRHVLTAPGDERDDALDVAELCLPNL